MSSLNQPNEENVEKPAKLIFFQWGGGCKAYMYEGKVIVALIKYTNYKNELYMKYIKYIN